MPVCETLPLRKCIQCCSLSVASPAIKDDGISIFSHIQELLLDLLFLTVWLEQVQKLISGQWCLPIARPPLFKENRDTNYLYKFVFPPMLRKRYSCRQFGKTLDEMLIVDCNAIGYPPCMSTLWHTSDALRQLGYPRTGLGSSEGAVQHNAT